MPTVAMKPFVPFQMKRKKTEGDVNDTRAFFLRTYDKYTTYRQFLNETYRLINTQSMQQQQYKMKTKQTKKKTKQIVYTAIATSYLLLFHHISINANVSGSSNIIYS